MVPEPSVPRMLGNFGLPSGHQPPRISTSHDPTPAVWTLISTSLAAIGGTGSSWIFNTLAGPKRSMTAARMLAGMVGTANRYGKCCAGPRNIQNALAALIQQNVVR